MHKDGALRALIGRYMTQSGAAAKQTLEDILALPGAAQSVYGMAFGGDKRAALKTLADIARRKQGRDALAPLVLRDIDKLLALPDDKARKSAYRLIGLCAPDQCADKLMQALKTEKTRFVRPSIILALGNTTRPERWLTGYVVEPGEEKHMEAEREALKKALGKTAEPQKRPAVKLPESGLLTYVKCEALALELEARNRAYRQAEGMFAVRTADMAGLRCYEDALFDVGGAGDYQAAAGALDAMGLGGQTYRIEAGGIRVDKRREVIREVSAGLAEHGYADNPSAYAFELRLKNARMYAVFADKRFSYRVASIAAGINPVTAASIMRICASYMREGADVLDPFCGSATMLIERAFLMPAGSLVGVDISSRAIKAACANRRASGRRIALIHADILDYGAAQYDEVIANMPFGIRVLRHADNLRLYAAFVRKLPALLRRGGHAFLLTQEKKLLSDTLCGQRLLKLVHVEDFESGGLCPRLFIIKKEQTL